MNSKSKLSLAISHVCHSQLHQFVTLLDIKQRTNHKNEKWIYEYIVEAKNFAA